MDTANLLFTIGLLTPWCALLTIMTLKIFSGKEKDLCEPVYNKENS
jgi:hypothetical protein